MGDPYQLIQLSVSNTLTIPTYSTIYRTDLPVATELLWSQSDDGRRDSRIIHVKIEANGGGTPAALTLSQILGGHDGTDVMIRMANAGDTLTIEHDNTKIVLPFDSDMIITSHLRPVLFSNIDGAIYSYVGN